MFPHVRDFRDFYERTEGRLIRRVLSRRLREAVGDAGGKRILAIGFGTPFLRPFVKSAVTTVAVMSGRTGAVIWPRRAPCRVVIADETEMPFPDRSFDRVILVHGLEWSPNPQALMRDVWRVLADDGRLVAIAPNRRSVWSALDRTPFGHGRPYSRGQLNALLRETLFTPVWSGAALAVPPGATKGSVTFARIFERAAARWFPGIAALIMATAVKQIYGVTPIAKALPVKSFAEVVSGSSRGAHPRAVTAREGTPRRPRADSPSGCRR